MKFKHLPKQLCIVVTIIIFICMGDGCMAQNPSISETETLSTTQPDDATSTVTIGEFSITDYQWGIVEFPSNEVLTKIENAEDLIKKGKHLWSEILDFHPNEDHIIKTYYDVENDCWMVTAEIDNSGNDHAVPTAIIYTNGTVVAVWRE